MMNEQILIKASALVNNTASTHNIKTINMANNVVDLARATYEVERNIRTSHLEVIACNHLPNELKNNNNNCMVKVPFSRKSNLYTFNYGKLEPRTYLTTTLRIQLYC